MKILALGNEFLCQALMDELDTMGYKPANTAWRMKDKEAIGLFIDSEDLYSGFTFENSKSQDGTFKLPQEYDTVIVEAKAALGPQYKVGDYVYWIDNYGGLPSSNGWFNKGDVVRVEGINSPNVLNLFSSRRQMLGGFNPANYGHQFRKATRAEIEAYLIAEAQKKGFKIGEGVSGRLIEYFDTTFSCPYILRIAYHATKDELSIVGKVLAKTIDETVGLTIYRQGKWLVEDVKSYIPEPKLTFGGKEVTLELTAQSTDVTITCEGISDYYWNFRNILKYYKELREIQFGPHKRKVVPIDQLTISFGCTSGKWTEFFAVLNACRKLLGEKEIIIK